MGTVGAAFQSILASVPDSIAVEGDRARWTYRELDARAAAVAARLASAGVGRGDRVALVASRSPEFIAAILGVVRLGAVYAPIDTASPPARQVALLETADPKAILLDTHERAASISLAAPAAPRVLLTEALAAPSVDLGWAECGPDDPIYIMHTSGSTGRPKAVVIPHRGVHRLVVGADFADLAPPRRWAFLSSVAFDASTLEIWAPLLNGATCVVQEDSLPSLEALAGFFERRGISDAWLTSALFNTLVDEHCDALRGLSQLLVGGERESPARMARLLERCPGTRLIHGYGPTENTTFSLCHTVTREDAAGARVPIGRPIRGTTARIEPIEQESNPLGSDGELLVGGDGLALGYLGDPELTASRFVERDGSRWYRTGDLVKERSNGAIEFVGRADRQVKLNGHRIEIAEIEGAIAACPGVVDVVVFLTGCSTDTNRLVACYTTTSESGPGRDRIREAALTALPPIMVPSVFRRLDRFPANLNGKVDLAALRRLAGEGSGSPDSNPHVHDGPPTTEFEPALAEIWRRRIGVARISRSDTFMALGGHSLTAMRVAADVRRELARELSPQDLLGPGTLAEIAAGLRPIAAPSARKRVDAEGTALTAIQRGVLRACELDGTHEAYLVSTAFTVPPPVSPTSLERAFGDLFSRHEAFRLTVAGDSGDYVPVLRSELEPHWCTHHEEVIDSGVNEVPARALETARRGIDIARLASRLDIWPRRGGGLLGVWTVHHAMVDEWSIHMGLEEVASQLRTQGAGKSRSGLAYARFEAGITRSELAISQATEVADVLRGSRVPIPAWRGRSSEHELSISEASVAGLRAIADRASATWVSPLLVAYGMAIQEIVGPAWRFVTTPIAKRSHPEIVDTLECCLEMRLIECGLRPGEGHAEAIARVHATLSAAADGAVWPMEHLVGQLRAMRPDLGEVPMQFAFTARRDPRPRLEMPGGTLTVLHVPQGRARFAVALHAEEQDGRLGLRLEVSEAAARLGYVDRLTAGLCRAMSEIAGEATPQPSPAGREAVAVAGWTRPSSQAAAPTDASTRGMVADAWETVIGRAPSDDGAGLLASGGSSLGVLRLVAEIRRRTGVIVDAGQVMEHSTFGAICAMVAEGRSRAFRPWLEIGRVRDNDAILVIPGAGGEAIGLWSIARQIARQSGERVPLIIVDVAELARRADEPFRPDDAIKGILRAIEEAGPRRVRGILGYSLGGLLGLATASALEHGGGTVDRVWLLDTFESRLMRRDPHLRASRKLLAMARNGWAGPSRGGTASHPNRRSRRPSRAAVPGAEPALDWHAFAHRLGRWPIERCRAPCTLLRSTLTAREVGVLRHPSTNGFDPARFATLTVIDLEFAHLELVKSGAAEVARHVFRSLELPEVIPG